MLRRMFGGGIATAVVLSVLSPASAAVLKAVQSGTATIPASTQAKTVTIQSIDMTKAFLVFSTSFNDANPDFSQVSGQITNATTLTFSRHSTTPTPSIAVQWYVAEFTSGVTVQRGSLVTDATTKTVTLSPAVTVSKSFPLFSYRTSGTTYGATDFQRVTIIGGGAQLQMEVNSADATGTVEWQVVQWDSANVTSKNLMMASGLSSVTDNLATAVNLNKTLLLYSYLGPAGSNIAQKLVRGRLLAGSPQTAVFDRLANGTQLDLNYFTVEFTDNTTVQSGSQSFGTTDTVKTVALSSICPSKTIAMGGYVGHGGRTDYTADDNPGTGWMKLSLQSGSSLNITRGIAGPSNADIGWSALTFSDGGTACTWYYDTLGSSLSAPPLNPTVAIYAANQNGDITALDINPSNATPDGTMLSGWTDFTMPVNAIRARLGVNTTNNTMNLGSDDGCFYQISSSTGARNWWSGQLFADAGTAGTCDNTSERLADAIFAAPVRSGNTVYVASRNTSLNGQTSYTDTQNMVWALDTNAKTCSWVFNGNCLTKAAGATRVGYISNTPVLDATNNCIYFTTHQSSATDATVWAVATATGGCNVALQAQGTAAWSVDKLGSSGGTDLGNIDAAPALSFDRCTLYVGTAASGGANAMLYAINTHAISAVTSTTCTSGAAGTARWTGTNPGFSTGVSNGNFSESIWVDNGGLFFAVNNGAADKVMRVDDPGSGVAPPAAAVWSQSVSGGSFPIVNRDLNHVWLGSTDGNLHQLCRDTATSPCSGSQIDKTSAIEPGIVIGAPTLDIRSCTSGASPVCNMYVGSNSGRIYVRSVPY